MPDLRAREPRPKNGQVVTDLAATDSIGMAERPGELPVLVPVREEHLWLAVRAMVTHAPQESASGVVCRKDGQAFPCRLARWGRRLLVTVGVSEQRVDEMVAAGDPYASPLALTATRDGTYRMVIASDGDR